jgi:rhodanese-related sulfurtransferase
MRRLIVSFSAATLLTAALGATAAPATKEVRITEFLPEVKVNVQGKIYTIDRIQDQNNDISGAFAKTSRKCPPFCIHAMEAAPGVITVGEIELLEFLKNRVERGSGLLVDARAESWYLKGTIPGSVNIPFTAFTGEDKNPAALPDALARLGVRKGATVNWSDSTHRGVDEFGAHARSYDWDFSGAKDVLLFCNGPWCDQSPRAIRALVKLGYPVNKIYYYRGGMQDWLQLGLTITVPAQPLKPASAPAAPTTVKMR